MELIMTGILAVISSFAFFKVKQSQGRSDMNEIMANLGGGSFFTGLKLGLINLLWWIIAIASFMGAMIMLNKYSEAQNTDLNTSQNISQHSVK